MKSPVKISEVLDQFAGGYSSRGESPEEIQDLLNVACSAWNIACLPAAKRETALAAAADEYRKLDPGADDLNDLLNDLRLLIARKDERFPELCRMVANARIVPIDDRHFRIETAPVAMDPPSAPLPPPPRTPARRPAPPASPNTEEHLDVLQNIEYAIVSTHRENPDMADAAVMRALEALIDRYKAQKAGRPQREWRPSEVERDLESHLFAFCEWRMGRAELLDASALAEQETMNPIPVEGILKCLKRILKSVQFWNNESGSRGYLDFIGQYFP